MDKPRYRSQKVEFRTLDAIIEDLSKAISWFEDIEISTKETRLQAIHSYLLELHHFPDPDPGAIMPDTDTYSVVNDAAAFGLIASEMSKLPPHLIPRKTLKDILKGPLPPSDEDLQNSDSRNKFVELELAAHLSQAGFSVIGFDDVQFEFDDCRYLVECKRPSHDRKFEDNLGKAYRQLAERFERPNDRGLVAIAVEKMFKIDSRIQNVDNSAAALSLTIALNEQLVERTVKYGTTTDVRIVGILFITRFLMRTKTPGTFAMNYLLGLVPFNYTGLERTSESARVLRLIAAVQEKFRARDTGFQ
jgi:hypothetical protein